MLVLTIESLLIHSVNGRNIFVPDKVLSMHNDNIDMEKLSLHLRILRCKNKLTEVDKLLKLFFITPVTTAECSRSAQK